MKHNKNNGSNVPNLRFSEFKGEWAKTTLHSIAEITKGTGISKDQLSLNGVPCILYGELYTKYKSEIISEIISRTELNSSNLVKSKANDVIIPSSGETAIDISTARCVSHNDILLGGDLNIIRLKNGDGRFLSYQLNGTRKLDIAKMAQGVSVVHLYGEKLKSLQVFIPEKAEQHKISSLLTLIDERISTQNKIIEKLESLIKGLYTISQKSTWKLQLLTDLLDERKEQNANGYTVFSVAVNEGLINQVEHLGRSFAAKDTNNYNVVRFGDVVYTKSPTGSFPYGIIKQSLIDHPVAVSPLYGVYQPKNIHIGNILHHYFLSPINANNYLHSLTQKGAKNTINITSQHFLDKTVRLPTDNLEIENLSLLLTSIRQKIHLEKEILNQLNNQKYFLLKGMFI